MQCKLCGKEREIFKIGCCKSCYRYNIIEHYSLKPYAKFRIDSSEKLVKEFLENQNVDKNYLADKYCVSLRNVYYAIRQYCDKSYVRRDTGEIIK